MPGKNHSGDCHPFLLVIWAMAKFRLYPSPGTTVDFPPVTTLHLLLFECSLTPSLPDLSLTPAPLMRVERPFLLLPKAISPLSSRSSPLGPPPSSETLLYHPSLCPGPLPSTFKDTQYINNFKMPPLVSHPLLQLSPPPFHSSRVSLDLGSGFPSVPPFSW